MWTTGDATNLMDVIKGNGSTPDTAKLVISFDPSTGQVNVSGPIQDRIFCFGIIELAKQAINAHAEQQAKQILVASPLIMPKQQRNQ